jgi:peptidoglycan/LPS O-acetylase OafA/YrhL
LFSLLPGLRFAAPVTASGFMGVEVFFVLSGFIIAYNYAESLSERGSYRRYLWARAARIYPVHLATLAAMGVLFAGAAVAKLPLNAEPRNIVRTFAANILMLQALPSIQAINTPSWSVSCECAAYIIFPFLGWWAARLSARRALAWAVVVISAGIVAILAIGTTASLPPGTVKGNWPISYPVMWSRIGCEFPAGVLLWAWWRYRAGSRWWDWVAVGSAGAVIAVCCSTGPSPAKLLALPAIALFVVACSLASGFVRKFLSARLMQWGGRISYSLYMTHFIVLLIGTKLVGWHRFDGAPLLERIFALAVWIGVVGATAAASFYLVEEPVRRLMRRVPRST